MGIGKGMEESKEASERWTDTIYEVVSWVKKKKSLTEAEIFKKAGIPAGFDYIE